MQCSRSHSQADSRDWNHERPLERQDQRLGDWDLDCVCAAGGCVATPWVGTQGRGFQSRCWCSRPRMFALWIEWGSGAGKSVLPKAAQNASSLTSLPHLTKMVSFFLSFPFPRPKGIYFSLPLKLLCKCFHECVFVCAGGTSLVRRGIYPSVLECLL